MNKKLVWIVGGFVGIVVAAVAYLVLVAPSATTPADSDDTEAANTAQQDAAETTETRTPTAPSDDTPTAPATYVAYASDKFTADQGTKVLFFHASWCPQCRALDADITSNLSSLSDVTIYKVDYDTATDLRKQYGVTQQTTVVKTDGSGAAQAKFVAYDTPTLDAVARQLSL